MMAIAKELALTLVTIFDIDENLIAVASKHLANDERKSAMNNNTFTETKWSTDNFPIRFGIQTIYVVDDGRLLDMKQFLFETILFVSPFS